VTYARYNVLLDEKWLADKLGLQFSANALSQIAQMDDPKNMDQLADLGQRASKQVTDAHFCPIFDI
jgi:hypothetical protein